MRSHHGRSASLELILALHPDVAFAADVSDGSARIDLIRVPRPRSGLGTLVYRSWEAGLDPGTEVTLDPVDEGCAAFWRSLGFTPSARGGMVRIVPRRAGQAGYDTP